MPILVCGRNDDGALGLGHTRDAHTPTLVEALADTRVVMVAAGSGHTAFLCTDGRVLTAGRGDDNRLGHGDGVWAHTPVLVAALVRDGVRVSFVACGSYHTAMLSTTGQLYTCGGAMYAKLGHGGEEPCPVPRPVAALQSKRVLSVACGSRHTVALVSEPAGNQVWSWGDAEVCGMGAPPQGGGYQAAPYQITGLAPHNVQQIAACGFHTLALSAAGTVFAFGEGKFGRLGTGAELSVYAPTPVAPATLRNVVFIAAGGFHSAAVDSLGQVWTWGGGEHGATGLGSTMNQLLPVRVSALADKNIVQVACGWSHTVFLADDHSVYACGNNDHGKCGFADDLRCLSPRLVEALSGLPVVQVASYNEHTVFLTDPDGPAIDEIEDADSSPQHAWYAQYYLRALGRLGGTAGVQTITVPPAEPAEATALFVPALVEEPDDQPANALEPRAAGATATTEHTDAAVYEHTDAGLTTATAGGANARPGMGLAVSVPGGTRAASAFARGQLSPAEPGAASAPHSARSQYASAAESPGGAVSRGVAWRARPSSAAVAAVVGSMPAGLPTASPSAAASTPGHSSLPPLSPPLSMSMRASLSSSGVTAAYSAEMARLVNNPDLFPDIRFIVEERVVFAHRGILATRCPQFFAMFSSGMRESCSADGCVPVHDIGHDIFLALLHFLYTDALPPGLDAATSVELYAAAERFMIDRLKLLCERRTLRGLSIQNAAALLAAADADPACSQLKAVCLRYVVDNFDNVVKTDGFRSLSKELILEVLEAR